MLCQKCKKNDATTHFIETVNGIKHEYFLCQSCAAGQHLTTQSFMDFDKLLSNMFFEPKTVKHYPVLKCPTCGADLGFLEETGKVGCADCYKALSGTLSPYIEKLHHGLEYKGKIPENAGQELKKKRVVELLKKELSEAVAAQEYETAATLRDKIKKLEGLE